MQFEFPIGAASVSKISFSRNPQHIERTEEAHTPLTNRICVIKGDFSLFFSNTRDVFPTYPQTVRCDGHNVNVKQLTAHTHSDRRRDKTFTSRAQFAGEARWPNTMTDVCDQ